MLSLYDIQKNFIAALRDEKNANAIFAYINPTTKLSVHEHFFIYKNSIIGALQKTLQAIYFVINKLVGDDFFIGMANYYIAKTPSYSSDLSDYGATFANFIADFPPAQSLPYLADVAHLEWASHSLFSVADNPIMNFQKLAACYTAGNDLLFLLPNGSSLLHSVHPIHRIWEVNQSSYTGDQTIILEENMEYYFLIWRQNQEIRIDLLTHTEWQILTWINEKLTLSALCETAAQLLPNADVTEILPQFVSRGWLVDFLLS